MGIRVILSMISLSYSDFWILFWDIQKTNQLVGDEDKKEIKN